MATLILRYARRTAELALEEKDAFRKNCTFVIRTDGFIAAALPLVAGAVIRKI